MLAWLAAALFYCYSSALQDATVRAGLMDASERDTLFVYAPCLDADVQVIAGRILEAPDLPPLCEADLFPPLCICTRALALNRRHRECLEARRPLYPRCWDSYTEALHETDRPYEIWIAAQQASNSKSPSFWRREGLMDLRRLLGADDYYRGRLPLPIPLRHCREAD